MVMKSLDIIAGVYLTLYLIYIRLYLGKWPGSISKSLKELKQKKIAPWPFFLLIGLSATTLLIHSYENLPEYKSISIMAIGALGIFGVGTFAYFWKGKIGIWHYLFASSGFSLSALSFWLDFGDPWKSAVTGVAALLVLAASWNKNPILWVEISISYCLLLFILI